MRFGKVTVDIVDMAIMTALLLLGPLWAIFVAVPSMVYRERLRTVFEAATHILMLLSSGFAFYLFTEPLLLGSRYEADFVYGAFAAGTTYYILDALISSGLMFLKHRVPLTKSLKDVFMPLVPSDIAAVLAAIGTAYVMVFFGPAALVLFTGAVAAVISLHLIHTRQRENEALKVENAKLLDSGVGFAAGIVGVIGEKDGYTARLAAASSVYAGDVGREFGFDKEKVGALKLAALLQDVGFIGVPDEVLTSPSERLNPVGRMRLERHPVQSEKILSGAPGFAEAAKWVRWHHEREDGAGYPDRLKARWIPLEARILAACETYASLVLDGPHSPVLAAQEARIELTSLSEKRLDGEVVRTLLRVLDREDADYATADDDRFAFTNPAGDDMAGNASPSLRG